jgi:radical SAM protein with 4Fe4S-binding SPASM domain
MTKEVWHRVLAEAAPYVHTIQFYFQGEPLLNKDLPSMIREAHEAGIYTIVSTNAQALTPDLATSLVRSGLNRIILSMDGLTQETYNAYRIGGDLQKCKDALRWLREAKDSLTIELQVLRLRSNEHEWETFKREYKALGADRLVFKTAQLYDYADGHPLMPSDPQYSRYEKGADGHYHRKPISRGCFRAWSGAVITTTGEVLPCCYDKGHAYSFGNILSASLTDLYNNEKAVSFRKAALKHQHPICQECWK